MPSNHPLDLHANNFHSLILFLLALVNYALLYTTNIILARSLEVGDFDDYSVAISIVTMLSTVATLGLEKHALRAIPVYTDQHDWGRLRGFWLFSIRSIAIFSLLLMALLSVSLEYILALHQADYHISIIIYAGFLPIIALTLFLVEVIAAQGAYVLGMALYRLLLPLLLVLFLLVTSYRSLVLSAEIAVLCYGAAWIIVFIIMGLVAKKKLPRGMIGVVPTWQSKKWLKASLPLVMSSLLLTIMTSSGVVILELFHPSGLAVGLYAVAAQTGGIISLVGTSTNRYYLPKMVVLIEHKDSVGIQKLMQQRLWVVGSLILLLLLGIYYLGPNILSLFGPQFTAAYQAMVIIAVGASVSALFADIPYYLQFMGYHRRVLSLTLFATVCMVSGSFLWAQAFAQVGVAVAYMLPVVLLFTGFRIMAVVRFRKMNAKAN